MAARNAKRRKENPQSRKLAFDREYLVAGEDRGDFGEDRQALFLR
jgi:hypothetical protein